MISRLFAVCLALALTAPADAQPSKSPLVRSLADCRSHADNSTRLQCYDAATAALIEAEAKGHVTVVDQQDMRKARRSLFGFSLPKLPLFDGDRSAGDQQDEITAKIASTRALRYGKWQVKLEDGAMWETTEASSSPRGPRAGDTVVIKRGLLGSYTMKIAGQRNLRVKRIS